MSSSNSRLLWTVVIVAVGVNILLTNLIFYYVPLEKHFGPEHEPPGGSDRVKELRNQVTRGLDEIVSLKVQLLEAVENAQEVATTSALSKRSEAKPAAPPSVPRSKDTLPYLMIAMTTVARKKADYLGPTLQIIEDQLIHDPKNPLFGQIKVLVMNNDHLNKRHVGFERAKAKHASSNDFVFVTRDAPDTDVAGQRQRASPNVPGAVVRKQSRDNVALLRYAAKKSHYLLLMEDDFALCPHALRTMLYLLDKAQRFFPNWITAKISYGMNGILMKNGASGIDVLTFAGYLLKRHVHRPPDHLYTEWAAGETPESREYKAGRPHLAFRFNLLHHSGTVSSLRDEKTGAFPKCFDELVFPTLFEVDAFKPRECGHDDMWPCPPKARHRFLREPYRKPSDRIR